LEENVRRGDVWLDVGAHYGYTALALARFAGEAGAVYAFEPVLQTATHLMETKARNELNNLTVVPMALTDSPVIAATNTPVIRGMADHHATVDRRHTIYGVSLDALAPLLWRDGIHVDGIKMDVQGMEIQALSGMAHLLQKDHPRLVVELHAGVDRTSLLALLRSIGYSTSGRTLDGVSRSSNVDFHDDTSYVFDPRERVGGAI